MKNKDRMPTMVMVGVYIEVIARLVSVFVVASIASFFFWIGRILTALAAFLMGEDKEFALVREHFRNSKDE